jgi:recombination protein RecA
VVRSSSARADLESLLKARKLDVTLTTAAPWAPDAVPLTDVKYAKDVEDVAATGVADLDQALGGGLRRGHLSEIVGPRSSGRTTVMCQALAHAIARGELAALVDPWDRFDPVAAAAMGVDLSHLLWVRDTGDPERAPGRAIKGMNLVLQAGGFGLVVLDLADVPAPAVRGLPFTTWFRLARVIEGSATAAVLVAAEHVARSSGGATIAMERSTGSPAIWNGLQSNRARLLAGLEMKPRVVRAGSW